MLKIFKKLKDTSGSVVMEFSLILPVILLLFFGMIEISNFTYASQKNQTAAIVAASLVSSMNNLQDEIVDDLLEVSEKVTEGIIDNGNYGIIVTIIQESATSNSPAGGPVPYVVYQRSYGNTAIVNSKFSYTAGTAGADVDQNYVTNNEIDPADINNHTFNGRNQIVIVETSTIYTPIFNNTFTNKIFNSGFQISFETPPSAVEIGHFRFLPDSGGTMGGVIP